MENKIFCSIIINTYNRAKILKERSLPSALNQITQFHYEVIVIDDCSTDDTEELMRGLVKVYPKLSYYKHKENYGLSTSRNSGARVAKGEFIIFLDDDDELAQYTLEAGLTIIEKSPNINIAIGSRIIAVPNASVFSPVNPINNRTFYVSLDDGFIIRKKVFDEIQYDETLLTNEDADFGIQYMRKYGSDTFFVFHNCFLIKYGHTEKEKSWGAPSERTYIGMEKYMKKNLPLYYEHAKKHNETIELLYILNYMGRLYCEGGRIKEGFKYFLQAFKVKPTINGFKYLVTSLLGPKIFYSQWKKVHSTFKVKKI